MQIHALVDDPGTLWNRPLNDRGRDDGLCWPDFADGGGDFVGARMVDCIQSVERRRGQVGQRTGNAPEQDDTILVGYSSDCIDEFR